MGQLRGWGAMAGAKIELGVPLLYLFLATLAASLGLVSSALWAGATTPGPNIITTSAMLAVPSFANTTLIREYPSEAHASGPQVYTRQGMFSYSVGIKFLGGLVSSAASATTADGSVRKHAKLDNTQFVYGGRSFGAGAGVGIMDEDVGAGAVGRATGYDYVETGYEAVVSCIRNASTDFSIDPSTDTFIWPVTGRLPDSDGSGEYSDYFGHDSDAIVAMGVATGATYGALDTTQCTVDFVPARFHVSVRLDSRNISVAKLDGPGAQAVADVDPGRTLTTTLLRQFELISNDLTNLYESVLGDALLSSVAAWNASHNGDGAVAEERATLAGVENALVAMADDMLALYGAAQLMVGNFSQPAAAQVGVSVLEVGQRRYVVAVVVLNAVIVAAAVVEAVRTRGWRRLPAFDFSDLSWLLLASFRGGTMSAGSEMSSRGDIYSRGEKGMLQVAQEDGRGVWRVSAAQKDIVVELKQFEDRGRDMVLMLGVH